MNSCDKIIYHRIEYTIIENTIIEDKDYNDTYPSHESLSWSMSNVTRILYLSAFHQ